MKVDVGKVRKCVESYRLACQLIREIEEKVEELFHKKRRWRSCSIRTATKSPIGAVPSCRYSLHRKANSCDGSENTA